MEALQPPPKTAGLGFSAFARRYLRNPFWSLFLTLLRCFSSDGSPPAKSGIAVSLRLSYPIRKPPDRRIVGSSPTNIAASSVLPRLLPPRHPPTALDLKLGYEPE